MLTVVPSSPIRAELMAAVSVMVRTPVPLMAVMKPPASRPFSAAGLPSYTRRMRA